MPDVPLLGTFTTSCIAVNERQEARSSRKVQMEVSPNYLFSLTKSLVTIPLSFAHFRCISEPYISSHPSRRASGFLL